MFPAIKKKINFLEAPQKIYEIFQIFFEALRIYIRLPAFFRISLQHLRSHWSFKKLDEGKKISELYFSKFMKSLMTSYKVSAILWISLKF